MAEEALSGGAPDTLLGGVLGHCEIEALIGVGGMSRVYRALQRTLDRYVAVKVLPSYVAADPMFVQRFKREAHAMARLSHPNIITVHDTGEDQGRLYIIMEYVAGGNLKERMTPLLPMQDVTRIFRQVAEALNFAHSKNIIHRDVKPVNVLMDTNGRAVLSDFGIAKTFEATESLTRVGAGVGTPEYMSPEQCRGATVDQRADIYALGILLYEMLTGRTPFIADNYTALAHAHIYEQPPPPSRFNPRISPAVQMVVLKAIEKDPGERFQTALAMASALEQAMAAQAPFQPIPRPAQQPTPQGYAVGRRPEGVGHTPMGWAGCPACGALNQPDNRFCTRCGVTLIAGPPRVCMGCGSHNTPSTRFCTHCGQLLQ